MISTMDSISGGRMELGIGAGWKRDEWQAYGYGFPDTKARLARLEDDLEVITRMLAGDKHEHATFEGEHSSVRDAINVPKPIQRPRVPIMVGGNGPERDLAAGRALRRRAQPRRLVAGRDPRGAAGDRQPLRGDRPRPGDPARVPPSVVGGHQGRGAGRADLLAAYRELGISRVMCLDRASADTDEALEALVEDARAAGVELA